MIGPGSDNNGKIAIEWYKSDPNTLYDWENVSVRILRMRFPADMRIYALLRFIYLHKCLYFPNPNSIGMG